MAVIHNTTMTPGKLELVASWLPAQPWYAGTEPKPSKAGGFRLDDPQSEVGIEFMVVTDGSGDRPVAYHVPLTYRGAPLDGADHALVGTAEHGVLGRRWIYDGAHDPVLLGEVLALLQGRAVPQAQGLSNTPDPSVTAHFTGDALPSVVRSANVVNGPAGTDVVVETTTEAGSPGGSADRLTIQIMRVLQSAPDPAPTDTARGYITAGWHSPDGDKHRSRFVILRDTTH